MLRIGQALFREDQPQVIVLIISLEAKFIDKPERSPFGSGSQIPDFIRQRIMEQQTSEVIIISDGQAPPAGITTPPRRARWYDTFSYIANPVVVLPNP